MDSYYRSNNNSWDYSSYQLGDFSKPKPLASAPKLASNVVKIITLNTFQVPWFVSAYNRWANRIPSSMYSGGEEDSRGSTCLHQTERAERLVERIKGYDIVALQEMWGANLPMIHEAMKKEKLEMPEELTDHIYEGRLAEYYNHKAIMAEATGGLFFGTKTPIIWYRHHTFTYDYGETGLHKGVGFALLDMNKFWEGKYLLVCNVHMFSAHKNEDRIERQKQRDEINQEFEKMHTEELYPLGFEWDNCGVLLVGTFNTSYYKPDRSGRAMEYHKLMNDFAPRAGATRDFFIEKNPDQPRAKTYDFIHNQYVIGNDETNCGRVDYILGLNSIPRGNGMRTNCMQLEAVSFDIIRPDCERPPRQECSDHFAVVAEIQPATVQRYY
jgi:endonuclease/exonuclease/phosphatase family metal-dependent hydrolase